MNVPEDLRLALEGALGGVRRKEAAGAVERLIERYREEREARQPILASPADVAAYAAYRMPATYGAVRGALSQLAAVAPDFAPRRLLDLGGGTGAAAWAAVETFPTLEKVEVLDQVAPALQVGERLAQQASHSALRTAEWQPAKLDKAEFPAADLVSISYVLSELSQSDQISLVTRAATAAKVIAVIEPGTPAGYRRILTARTNLIHQGFGIAAPCPHENECPLAAGDWCHFAARVNRSSLHRQIKGADLSYEDEKYAYVIASRTPIDRAEGRILRHPLRRKGLVSLQVCRRSGTAGPAVVSKRNGDLYREAKDVHWGDPWPPLA
jgi:ribosomal protein RSM22 (predicted rRNA methylase)